MGIINSRSLISVKLPTLAVWIVFQPSLGSFAQKSYYPQDPFSIFSFLSEENQALYLLRKQEPWDGSNSLNFLSCTAPPNLNSIPNQLHPWTFFFHPITTTVSFFISYPLVHFSKLYFSSSWVCSSLSHLIWKKKKKSSSWIYIFFWQLSFFSQNSWRNSIQCFPLLHSIHLASFQKNFTNTAFANIISNLLFVKQIRLWRLCRSTLLPIHSYSLDFRAVLLHGLLPLSLYGVLPVGSVYNLAGHSSTSSTNPF